MLSYFMIEIALIFILFFFIFDLIDLNFIRKALNETKKPRETLYELCNRYGSSPCVWPSLILDFQVLFQSERLSKCSIEL